MFINEEILNTKESKITKNDLRFVVNKDSIIYQCDYVCLEDNDSGIKRLFLHWFSNSFDDYPGSLRVCVIPIDNKDKCYISLFIVSGLPYYEDELWPSTAWSQLYQKNIEFDLEFGYWLFDKIKYFIDLLVNHFSISINLVHLFKQIIDLIESWPSFGKLGLKQLKKKIDKIIEDFVIKNDIGLVMITI